MPKMKQQKIGYYFKKDNRTTENEIVIKEEVDIGWDDMDNYTGAMLNNIKGKKSPMRSVRVLIERLNWTNQRNIAVEKSNRKITKSVLISIDKETPTAKVPRTRTTTKNLAVAKSNGNITTTLLTSAEQKIATPTAKTHKTKITKKSIPVNKPNAKIAKIFLTSTEKEIATPTAKTPKTKTTKRNINVEKSNGKIARTLLTTTEKETPTPTAKALKTKTPKKNIALKISKGESKECPKCKKIIKIQSYQWHYFYCRKDRQLQCAHCAYKTKYKKSLIKHIPRYHPNCSDAPSAPIHSRAGLKKYCQKCEQSIEEFNLKTCEECLTKLILQCSVCKKTFNSKGPARYHWVTRCGVRGYYHCHSCDYKTIYRSRVVKHVEQVHPKATANDAIIWKCLYKENESDVSPAYQCLKCAKQMGDAHTLKWHMVSCKGVGNEQSIIETDTLSEHTKCSNCGKKFAHIHLLNKHIIHCSKNNYATKVSNDSEDEIIEVVEDEPPVRLLSADEIRRDMSAMANRYCEKCMEESNIEKSYRIGIRVQCDKCETTLIFKCKKCKKEFRTLHNLAPHVKYVCYPNEEYKCIQCDFKAVNALRVRDHYELVHVDDEVDCEKCGKNFKNPRCLKLHSKHCGLPANLECDLCPYKSKLKMYLQRHIQRCHVNLSIIDKRIRGTDKGQGFSRYLEADCPKCKSKQPLKYRLKTCKKCKTKLQLKCNTCKKRSAINNKKACSHVKAYLDTMKYECKRCGQGKASKTALATHKVTCGTLYRCRFCKYSSEIKWNTTKHEKWEHLET